MRPRIREILLMACGLAVAIGIVSIVHELRTQSTTGSLPYPKLAPHELVIPADYQMLDAAGVRIPNPTTNHEKPEVLLYKLFDGTSAETGVAWHGGYISADGRHVYLVYDAADCNIASNIKILTTATTVKIYLEVEPVPARLVGDVPCPVSFIAVEAQLATPAGSRRVVSGY